MILDKIVEDKKRRLAEHKARISESEMRRMAEENTGRFSVFCGNKYLIIRPKFEKFIDDSSEI